MKISLLGSFAMRYKLAILFLLTIVSARADDKAAPDFSGYARAHIRGDEYMSLDS